MRTVIVGGPGTGKTHMAYKMLMNGTATHVLHTDDLISPYLEWSELSERVSEWFDDTYDVIEGVAAARALRKWLKRNPEGAPCDRIVYLTRYHEEPSKSQAAMTKGIDTVFAEIRDDLIARGVEIEVRG